MLRGMFVVTMYSVVYGVSPISQVYFRMIQNHVVTLELPILTCD
jgi:hypothetical protein